MKYQDVNSFLSQLPLLKLGLDDDQPMLLGFARQLETVLSLCSIPVYGFESVESIALIDADPLNVCHDGRAS